MIRYACDRCGKRMEGNDANRYIVKMEIYAAAGPIELDLEPESRTGENLKRAIEELAEVHPDELEDKTYRNFRFDLCDACRREVLRRPLVPIIRRSSNG